MPTNKFPDSRAKRELRRQIKRRLERFKANNPSTLGLSYCGMPSVEFLDVIEWGSILRSVCAVEIDESNLLDMRIQWNRLSLSLPIRFVEADVLDFLETTSDIFDV